MSKPLRSVLLAAVISAGFVLAEAVQAYGAAGPMPGAAGPAAPVEVILAYVDPGAAGFIIVSVLGFFAAIGYTARSYLSRMKRMVFRGGPSAPKGEAPDPPDA